MSLQMVQQTGNQFVSDNKALRESPRVRARYPAGRLVYHPRWFLKHTHQWVYSMHTCIHMYRVKCMEQEMPLVHTALKN